MDTVHPADLHNARKALLKFKAEMILMAGTVDAAIFSLENENPEMAYLALKKVFGLEAPLSDIRDVQGLLSRAIGYR